MDVDFEYIGRSHHDERGRIIDALFMKYPRLPDDIVVFEYFDIFYG